MRAIHLSANLPEHFRGQAILWVVRWGSFQEIFWRQEGGWWSLKGGIFSGEGEWPSRLFQLRATENLHNHWHSHWLEFWEGMRWNNKKKSRVCSAVKYLGPSRPWGLKIFQFFSVCLDPVKKEWCSMINLEAIYMLIDHNIFSTGLFHVKKM